MSRMSSGARGKPRSQDICADCGATEPGWASINRGILICDECCSVHRSLGRHVSHVKSVKKGIWHPSLLAMVHALNNSGANSIWEHTLLDPSVSKGSRRKPHSKDPIHPNKADFIRAKHQMLSFLYRPNREENSTSDGDISRQLHSSVRTANLETSLRLLSLGADPNYYHTEKGNCPIHVAAKAGQISQLELLSVYGADPAALDKDGLVPADYAREGSHFELVNRLIELEYELTDSLAFYLCGRKPDHSSGQHWIVPEMSDALDLTDAAKEARNKLVSLPNHLFEELVLDVYDEVDRRESDSIWLSLQNQSALLSDGCSVPFLPVNPDYSATRNQGRQKLARFNAREFATLLIDILIETRRRMMGHSSSASNTSLPIRDKVGMEVATDRHLFTSTPLNTFSPESSPYSQSISFDHNNTNLHHEDGNLLCNNPITLNSPSNPLYASYDEVYTSEDDNNISLDSIDIESACLNSRPEFSITCEQSLAMSSDEDSKGDGCMRDWFAGGLSPLLGHRPSKKKSKKSSKKKHSLSNTWDHQHATNSPLSDFSFRRSNRSTLSSALPERISRHFKEFLNSTLFGDSSRKMTIIHPQLREDYLLGSPLTNSTSRSNLVRTLTLPMKYAQNRPSILMRSLSKSQPTSPELERKFKDEPDKNFQLSASNRHNPFSHSSTNKNIPILSFNLSSDSKGARSPTTHINDASQNDIRNPFPVTPDDFISKVLCESPDNPVLEPCSKCAHNLRANVQHSSFWSDPQNLPYGYIVSEKQENFEGSKTKQKEDCKMQ